MKTPVIIAARNEAEYIGRTLECLDASTVEPIVVVNGSDDNTARIAKELGAQVYEQAEAGKLPALQNAVKSLGERAVEPLIFLDADSRPLFPRRWAAAITGSLEPTKPTAAAGMVVYNDCNSVDGLAWNMFCTLRATAAKAKNQPHFSGANIALRLHDQATLKRFLGMPHIWYGEDRAIGRLIDLQGGETRQVISPQALVLTSGRYLLSVRDCLRVGPANAVRQRRQEDYRERAPVGSRPICPNSGLGY